MSSHFHAGKLLLNVEAYKVVRDKTGQGKRILVKAVTQAALELEHQQCTIVDHVHVRKVKSSFSTRRGFCSSVARVPNNSRIYNLQLTFFVSLRLVTRGRLVHIPNTKFLVKPTHFSVEILVKSFLLQIAIIIRVYVFC